MFEVKKATRDEALLVITGPLTNENIPQFHVAMAELVAGASAVITLDMTNVPAINSAAYGKILLFNKSLAEHGRSVRIRGCHPELMKSFRIMRFELLISVEEKA